MLIIKNLHAGVDCKELLKGINLEVKAGEVHAIMGLMERANRHSLLLLLEMRTSR